MKNLVRYLGSLRAGKAALWCYLIWYGVMAAHYFDARPALWINSLGISLVIGTGLVLSVLPPAGIRAMEKWAVARLFMIPFCVSSFAALIKDQDFVVVFSSHPRENLIALGACALFLAAVFACKWLPQRVTP